MENNSENAENTAIKSFCSQFCIYFLCNFGVNEREVKRDSPENLSSFNAVPD